jgi:hypothetical protein
MPFVIRKKKFSRCQICQLRTSNPRFLLRHLKSAHNHDLCTKEAAAAKEASSAERIPKNPAASKAVRLSKTQAARPAKKAPFVLPSYVRKAFVERKFNANPPAPDARFQCSVCRDEFESADILSDHVTKVHEVVRSKSRISKLADILKSGAKTKLARKLF